MQDSNKKQPHSGKHIAYSEHTEKKVEADYLRDESHLYGDEGEILIRRRKNVSSKASAKSKGTAQKAKAKKRKTAIRKKRKMRRSIFEIMSATGSDSPFKPIYIFGREFRFWPLFLLILLFLIVSGIMLNNSNITVVNQDVTVVGLPEDLEGYKIVVISDMNGRRFGDEQGLLLRTLNNQSYDAIFCLGDMVGKDGDPEPFYEFLDGLSYPEKVYFICGDSDPGPFVEKVRDITGTLSQMVLEDWILGAIERGANYVDAPISINVGETKLWISPATMLNLETTATLETWKEQTEQEEDGVLSGIAEDYASLPITSYRYQQMQKLYDAQREMNVSDIHISLAHEVPSEEYIYTSDEHDPDTDRYLIEPELITAGHYCGGVWKLPFIGAIYVPDKTLPRNGWFPDQKSIYGLSKTGEMQVYITGGLSVNSAVPLMPFRLLNSPEIAVLKLTSTLPENMLDMK